MKRCLAALAAFFMLVIPASAQITTNGRGIDIISGGSVLRRGVTRLQLGGGFTCTWNASALRADCTASQAGTFAGGNVTAPITGVDGSVTAPAYSFTSATNTGMYLNGGRIQFAVAGSSGVFIGSNYVDVGVNTGMIRLGSAGDVRLNWDASNTLALRNGVNPNKLTIYGTYTDGSNYERAYLGFTAGDFYVSTESIGTGAARNLRLMGGNQVYLGSGGSARWVVQSGGTFGGASDNTYDIGNIASTRPRTGYFGTSVVAPAFTLGSNTILIEDAPSILAQRNGGNAQTFRIYNIYTDASNFERARLEWNSNTLKIGTEKLGTGVARAVELSAAQTLYLGGAGTTQWFMTSAGLMANGDNTYDIGASGATRPRTGYFGTSVVTPAIVITTTTTPANSAAACTANTIWSDGTYIYYCVASGNIKRTAALATF